ncbi:MAG: response regulator [Kiritimatiellae bacterium]|jgi:CheY-like chemotaxis protein|nr:response regulator [Kiritimatiellia bacterium]
MSAEKQAVRILVVDDDSDVRLLLGGRLRRNGYEVVAAEDGESAVQIVRQENPALILLDLGLPKMDGFDVCRMLKADPATRRIPIIVLSAKSQQTDRDRASALGADGYMAKPFDPGVLLEEIRNLTE